MIDDNWQDKVVSWSERIFPSLSALLLMFLAYIPIYIGMVNNIRADLGLIAIYFWVLNRSDLFGLKTIVLMGLFDGVLSSSPFGLGLIAYLLMYVLMSNLSKFLSGRSFVVVWYGFMALSLLIMLLKWLLATIYYGQFLPIVPLILSYLQGAAIYPLVSLLLGFFQNIFLRDDEV